MSQLPMPSDVPDDVPHSAAPNSSPSDPASPPGEAAMVEPPSAKLLVRLFLIPFIIVAIAVGIVSLIGRMTGSAPTMEDSFRLLAQSGGERTADLLVGPGAKQRYMAAKTLVDRMKSGMTEADRIEISAQLIRILDHHTHESEGEVRHFLLLALGRAWQIDPSQPEMNSPDAVRSREQAVATLIQYAGASSIPTRKAALLALAYLKDHEQVRAAFPVLIEKLLDGREDLDVRMSAATALGPLAAPSDAAVIEALNIAYRESDPRNAELSWSAALSLAQLNQPGVVDTILMLLDRAQLARLEVYDREDDPRNPRLRSLTEQERQRILVNTMIGARHLESPAVQDRLKRIAETDPSPRVREAGLEILAPRREN